MFGKNNIGSNICGKTVKVLRLKAGLVQVDLAEALNVNHGFSFAQSYISEIERRVRGLRGFELKAIAQGLGVSIGKLFNMPAT